MFIAFVGAPCSGKTTTAARLFADLKDIGYSVEFIAEYARFFIAMKRRELPSDQKLVLTDDDQTDIMVEQARREEVMAPSDRVIVVSDSCALNSLLYMSTERRNSLLSLDLAHSAAQRYDLVFYCPPVRPGFHYDPNRVHSFDQSLELDRSVEKVLDLSGVSKEKVYRLCGDQNTRASEARGATLFRMFPPPPPNTLGSMVRTR